MDCILRKSNLMSGTVLVVKTFDSNKSHERLLSIQVLFHMKCLFIQQTTPLDVNYKQKFFRHYSENIRMQIQNNKKEVDTTFLLKASGFHIQLIP